MMLCPTCRSCTVLLHCAPIARLPPPSKRPLPKLHCQASHPRPLGERAQETAPHACLLARGGPLCPMAIRLAQCHAPSQQPTSAGGRHIEVGAFQLNSSSIHVGSNMKHVHTFGCSGFALQNALASGNQLPRWSPRVHLGLNLGPRPMHARNVYPVLNLVTGSISLQYHCCFDNFFEMVHHGASYVPGTICWQQLANLECAKTTRFKVSTPKQHSVISLETSSEEKSHTMSKPIFEPNTYDTMSDDYSISDTDLQVSENS
jgi:hypothetical protein